MSWGIYTRLLCNCSPVFELGVCLCGLTGERNICGNRQLDTLSSWVHSSTLSLHAKVIVLQQISCSCIAWEHEFLLFLNSTTCVFNIRVFSLVSTRSLSLYFYHQTVIKAAFFFFFLGLSFSGFPFLGAELTQNQHFPPEAALVLCSTKHQPLHCLPLHTHSVFLL